MTSPDDLVPVLRRPGFPKPTLRSLVPPRRGLVRLLLAAAVVAGIVARPAPARSQERPRPGTLPGRGSPTPRPDSVRADTVRSDAARRDTVPRAAADTAWDPLRALGVQFDGRMESRIDRVVDK